MPIDNPDDLRDRIAKNLQVCRERISAGEGTPQIGRLKKAIGAATAQHADFDSCGLVDGHKTPACPTTVAELHDSFVAAAGSATSELPWSMLRGLTLLLHNDHGATAAAWSLTVLALAQANGNKAAAPMLAALTADGQNLRAQLLQREFEVAIRAKRKSAMRTILAELISLTDAPAEKSEYARLLRKLRSQAVVTYLKWGFWTAVAGTMLLGVLSKEQAPVRMAAAPSTFRPAPISTPVPAPSPAPIVTPAPAPAPAAMQPVDRTATQPPPGSSPLSISGLRWCRYQQVRADGAEAYLEALRPDPNLKFERFNAAVAAYNAFVQPLNASCGSFTFRKLDATIIDAEVNELRVALTAAGRRAVEIVYLAASAPAAATTLPAYTPTPTYVPAAPAPPPNMFRSPYIVPPTPAGPQPDPMSSPPVTASYLDGQNDRRAWEAWIGSTSGATRDGAEWWAGVRSAQRPPSCSSVPGGSDPLAAAAGCNQARIRLGNPDRRRRADPDYRAGWNNP